MPSKGQVIVDPNSGDIYEFLETASDTGGKYVKVKSTVHLRGQLVPKHYHIHQDELFEVVSGQLTCWLDGEKKVIHAGEKITLPRNIPHNHYNDSDEPLCMIQTIAPALDFDFFIENLVGLASDGKAKKGKFGLLQEMVFLKYLESKTLLADIPVGLQHFMINTLGPVGRAMGYRAIYKKYSGFEK